MPIAPTTELKVPEKKTVPPIPDGAYQAQILDITDVEKPGFQAKPGDPLQRYFAFKFGVLTESGRGKWLNKDAKQMAPIPSENGLLRLPPFGR